MVGKIYKLILILLMGVTFIYAQDNNADNASFAKKLLSWNDLGIDVNGFLDTRAGIRTQNDPHEDDVSLAEIRLQLELNRIGDYITWELKSDFLFDNVMGTSSPDLEDGTGNIDLRTANMSFSPLSFMDVKLGRQILTWGTGDLLFINDLFPKDWQSFFDGRDVEYLKAPSDALFVSLYPSWFNINIAYTPRFDADRFINGERLSYWNPMLNRRAGQDAIIQTDRPDEWFKDDETAVRVSREIGGLELAAYGYYGFWKTPNGFNPDTEKAVYNKLSVYGGSVRTTVAGGIMNAEAGYYDSLDDTNGKNPFVPNSEMRWLIGYEHEVVRNFTASAQYYVELLQDYDSYKASLQPGAPARNEYRDVVTLRLTQLLLNQNLILSLFMYYSPADSDGYVRPVVKYKLTDQWLLTTGANVFFGKDPYTFFEQLADNNNIYVGARYNF